MEQCDVICMNRYWGWYVLGGQLDEALAGLEQELDAIWEQWQQADHHDRVRRRHHGRAARPAECDVDRRIPGAFIRVHLEVAARKHFVAGMQMWNFADFAAVQSTRRVGGLNMKGVFTRTRTPKMAAHVLREFWVKPDSGA